MIPKLELYAVQSKDGKWLRRKGYGGSGDCWVDDINKARIYPKIGGARSQITWWTTNYPEYGTPFIVKLTISSAEVIDESERVAKSINKRKQRKIDYGVARKQEEIIELQKSIDNDKKRLNELQK